MGLFSKTDIKKATGIKPQISDGMMDEITLWRDIYSNCPPWKQREGFDKVTGLAKTVCRDVAQKCTAEGRISTGDDALDADLSFLTDALPEKVERVLALGAGVARPYYDADKKSIGVEWYPADRVVPLVWKGEDLVSVALLDFATVNNVTYCKVETHVWQNGTVSISSKAYVWNGGRLGGGVSLSAVDEWKDITEETIVINNLKHPLFCYIKTPIANNIDGSKLGVSIFSNAVDQLEEIDKTFTDMAWERTAGKSKVFVAESMIPQKMVNGKAVDDLSAVDREMYKVLDGGVEKDLFEVSAPSLRFDQYKAQMDELITLACKNMGLDAKSFTSDHQGNAVTAQQILSEKNETYTTVLNLQEKMLKPALRDILESIRAMQILYGIKAVLPEDPDEVTISFGDSLLIDEESERQMAISEVQRGLRSKLSYLMDYRGMSEEDALREIELIKADAPVIDYFGDGAGM